MATDAADEKRSLTFYQVKKLFELMERVSMMSIPTQEYVLKSVIPIVVIDDGGDDIPSNDDGWRSYINNTTKVVATLTSDMGVSEISRGVDGFVNPNHPEWVRVATDVAKNLEDKGYRIVRLLEDDVCVSVQVSVKPPSEKPDVDPTAVARLEKISQMLRSPLEAEVIAAVRQEILEMSDVDVDPDEKSRVMTQADDVAAARANLDGTFQGIIDDDPTEGVPKGELRTDGFVDD